MESLQLRENIQHKKAPILIQRRCFLMTENSASAKQDQKTKKTTKKIIMTHSLNGKGRRGRRIASERAREGERERERERESEQVNA